MEDVSRPSVGVPFRQWCKQQGFSVATGYREARDARLIITKVRGKSYVTPAAAAAWLASLATFEPEARAPAEQRAA